MRTFWLTLLLALVAALIALPLACDDDDDSGDDDASPGDDDTASDDDSGVDDDDTTLPTLTWATIPKFTFEMGCQEQDTECEADENPLHEVTVKSFEMMVYEVTQAQFEAAMGFDPSMQPDCDDCPVDSVTWSDAQSFCAAYGGRLPTEAEWESAARCGSQTIYICGDNPACLDDVAWYVDNGDGHPQAVGLLDANTCGLYDMSGNVWEWVADWYLADYYDVSPDFNPPGPGDGTERVARGGSSMTTASNQRVSRRISSDGSAGGFRCARDL